MRLLAKEETPSDWISKKIGSYVLGHKGGAALRPNDFSDTGFPVIPKKAIQPTGELLIENPTYCTNEFASNNKRSIVDSSYTITTLRDLVPTGPTIGTVVNFSNEEKYILSQGVYGLKLNDDLDKKYLSYLSNTAFYRKVMQRIMVGSTQVHIRTSEYLDLEIQLPPLPEQQKIAKILSTWDKAISTTERLIENSTQQKKALMQQLLTGKKRFGYKDIPYNFKKTRYGDIPVDWEYPTIKDISVQLSKKNTDGKDYPVVSCSKHYGFVDSLDYFKKKVYSDDTSGYRIIPRNAFGFPSNHIEEGSIGVQTVHDIAIASPIYVVFKADPKLINNTYLYALLKTEHYRQIFCAATNASVDRRGSLRWKEFSAIRIPLPPLKEQQKIATVLTNADREIELLKQQLADLQQEKKALMQVLLTGKKRVVVSGELV